MMLPCYDQGFCQDIDDTEVNRTEVNREDQRSEQAPHRYGKHETGDVPRILARDK